MSPGHNTHGLLNNLGQHASVYNLDSFHIQLNNCNVEMAFRCMVQISSVEMQWLDGAMDRALDLAARGGISILCSSLKPYSIGSHFVVQFH